jgi:hypothetical protein
VRHQNVELSAEEENFLEKKILEILERNRNGQGVAYQKVKETKVEQIQKMMAKGQKNRSRMVSGLQFEGAIKKQQTLQENSKISGIHNIYLSCPTTKPPFVKKKLESDSLSKKINRSSVNRKKKFMLSEN